MLITIYTKTETDNKFVTIETYEQEAEAVSSA